MKIGVIKTGNIATSLVLEFLLDERADRDNLDASVSTSGAKMDPKSAEEAASKVLEMKPELVLYSTPNPSAPGPKKVISMLSGRKAVVIGDSPGIEIKAELEEAGLGYIFVKADSMIGARREFLDPSEMALFNSDMLKVLAVTGALRAVQEELDRCIESKGSYLPRVVVDKKRAIASSGIENDYARAKAMAALEMAEKVGEIDVKGCFFTKDMENYVPEVASAHELLRAAAKLADEVREIEKVGDEVYRTPHSRDGKILKKRKLMQKPK